MFYGSISFLDGFIYKLLIFPKINFLKSFIYLFLEFSKQCALLTHSSNLWRLNENANRVSL
jgi:hypothetical protein